MKSRWVTNPAAPGAAPTLAPSRKPPAAQEVVWRTASRTVRGGRDFRPVDDPALGLQRLSRSQGRQTVPLAVRVLCAGSAEASGDRAQGASGLVQRLSALRVPHSPEGLQPEPGPAHRACPQWAPQPRVRAAWPVLAFGFVALSCPGTSPDTRATRASGPHRNTGLIRSGEFCPLLWSHSENSSHQHIKEDAILPRPSMHRCLRCVK